MNRHLHLLIGTTLVALVGLQAFAVDDIHQWTATLTGPPSTPYAGGTFHLSLIFPTTYPFKPPAIKFVTPIYHPNVKTDTGDICADLISEGWGPTLNVKHCAQLLKTMLENPEPDHPLEAEIAQLRKELDAIKKHLNL